MPNICVRIIRARARIEIVVTSYETRVRALIFSGKNVIDVATITRCFDSENDGRGEGEKNRRNKNSVTVISDTKVNRC